MTTSAMTRICVIDVRAELLAYYAEPEPFATLPGAPGICRRSLDPERGRLDLGCPRVPEGGDATRIETIRTIPLDCVAILTSLMAVAHVRSGTCGSAQGLRCPVSRLTGVKECPYSSYRPRFWRSTLRLNVHFHVMALDGVYVRSLIDGAVVFHVETRAADVDSIRRRCRAESTGRAHL
jgi:hypothetical protein